MNTRTGFEFRNVCKSFGGRGVLDGVSFSLRDSQNIALIGESGCGKSTVLRLLAGLQTPDAGEVLLDGTTISRANEILVPPHRRQVSMVFQDLALWPNLSALDNVVLGLSALRLPRVEARSRAHEMLQTCGIEALADRLPGTLSGGEQQRIALARSLAPRPRFLFLDEPFAGLDGPTKFRILAEIRRIVQQERMTLIIVTHDLPEAASVAERAIVLEDGRASGMADLGDLFQQSLLPIIRSFRESVRSIGPLMDKS